MRRQIARTIFSALIFIGAAPVVFAQSAGNSATVASADIVIGISLNKTRDLNFGDIFPSGAGTVTVSPAGARTATGGSVLVANALNPPTAASFDTLRIGADNPKYWIRLPADGTITISNGAGGTMAVDNFVANVNCANTTGIAPANSGTCPGAPSSFSVGATLMVAATQAGGVYTGMFNVTVTRF